MKIIVQRELKYITLLYNITTQIIIAYNIVFLKV